MSACNLQEAPASKHTWFPKMSKIMVLLAYVANALAQNCITALDIARMSAVLMRKDDIMVAPGRMGYKLTTRKLSPSKKLPLMATAAQQQHASMNIFKHVKHMVVPSACTGARSPTCYI